MKVVMNVTGDVGVFHGIEGVITVEKGDIKDVSPKVANAWINDGIASPYVEKEPEMVEETVVTEEAESIEDAEEVETTEDAPKKRGRKKKAE